jgi:hypothetical protein
MMAYVLVVEMENEEVARMDAYLVALTVASLE